MLCIGTAAVLVIALVLFRPAGGQPPALFPEDLSLGKLYIYKKLPERDMPMRVHFPPDWKPTDRRAAIIFFFSGAWYWGDLSQFYGQAQNLAALGMVAIRADYRAGKRMPGSTVEESTQDAKSAIRWVRAHASELGVDPDRIVMSGGSAGGHISACALLCEDINDPADDLSVSSHPNALALYSPVLEFDDTAWEPLMHGDRDLENRLSPLHLIKGPLPPTLMVYGGDDHVLIRQGKAWRTKALEQQSDIEMVIFEGRPHDVFKMADTYEKVQMLLLNFLALHGYLDAPYNKLYAPSLGCIEDHCNKEIPFHKGPSRTP